jgi:hypothetical protein
MLNFAKSTLLATFGAALLTLSSGCSGTVGVGYGYRVYGPYYQSYHAWGPDDTLYYNRWIVENRRPHRDYRRLKEPEQRQFWQWRHDHDHDQDRGRGRR